MPMTTGLYCRKILLAIGADAVRILVALYAEHESRAWTPKISGLSDVDDCLIERRAMSGFWRRSCLPVITWRVLAFFGLVAASR